MSVLLQAQLCTLNYFNGIQILTKRYKICPLDAATQQQGKVQFSLIYF